MSSRVEPATRDSEWLRRAVLVLRAPRAVFATLRDDSDATAHARQEAVLALLWLAGIAGVLASPVARTLLDDSSRDGLVVAVWAFIGGGLYGGLAFWLGGALVHAAARALGGQGTYRRARHLVAFAGAPVALSLLVVWPVGIAAFGGDLFRSGGADAGAGGDVFFWSTLAFGTWALALLAIGIRVVYDWAWSRSLGALALAATPLVLVVLVHELV